MAYCHDSVGIGHLRRTMAICERIGEMYSDSSFLLATGTPYVPLFNNLPRVDYMKLPALAKEENGHYGSKFLNITLDRLIRCRESLLIQAAEHFDPDVMLVDKAPLGVCRELVPTLRWLREHRPNTRIIFGMRDIEDSPEATIRQWAEDGVVEMLEACFDEVWVYGMPDVFNPVVEYQLPKSIQDKLRFMGYISRAANGAPPEIAHSESREILVTVGGGTDGEALLDTYLSGTAERASQLGFPSTIIGGPDLPREVAARLRRRAEATAEVEWLDFEPHMRRRIAQSRLIVSMGGYNTLCEVVSLRKPVLVIPRIRPRLEQAIRAQRWAQRGAVFLLHPSELSSKTLADRVVALLEHGPSRTDASLDLSGLDRVAERFQAFWSKEGSHAASVCV